MAGVSEDGVSVEESTVEKNRRGLSGSMSLRTRKLGRRLSRSMSIVALKLPEKAHSITRSSSKLMRSGNRDKKNRSFELSVILPDKTQKQKTYRKQRSRSRAAASSSRAPCEGSFLRVPSKK